MRSEIKAVIELDAPLDQPGEYAVRHDVMSIDGDRVEGAYLFTFDPGAASPQPLFVEGSDDEWLAWFAWVLIGVGVVVIVVRAWRLVRSIHRSREPGSTRQRSASVVDSS